MGNEVSTSTDSKVAREVEYRRVPMIASPTSAAMDYAIATDGSAPPGYDEHTGDDTITVSKSILRPDTTFIIQHRQTGRIVTLVEGELRLCDGYSVLGGFHWHCVSKDRWLGFRNAVSGTYLGHNERRKLISTARHHQSHEFFMERLTTQGGYELLTGHGNELRSIAMGSDGTTVVESKGDGDLWDFLKL